MGNKMLFGTGISMSIALLVIILVVVGIAIFAGRTDGLTEDEINKIIADSAEPDDVKNADEITDSNPDTPEPESTAEPTDTSGGTPTGEECVVSGEWKSLWVKERTSFDETGFIRNKALGLFKYTGNCKVDIYLEAGISPSSKVPLSLAPLGFPIAGRKSWCDNNINYNGHLFKDVKPGQTLVGVQFRPQTPFEEGTYKLTVGAYTGCFNAPTTGLPIKSGGVVVNVVTSSIKISDRYSDNAGGSAFMSWDKIRG